MYLGIMEDSLQFEVDLDALNCVSDFVQDSIVTICTDNSSSPYLDIELFQGLILDLETVETYHKIL